jgi:hypothetical protein
MDAHYAVDLTTPFVVGPGELAKLAEILERHVGTVRIQADCADGVSRSFPAIRDVIAYENATSTQITSIRIAASSTDFARSASVQFAGSRWRTISLDLRADDDLVAKLKTETLEIVEGTRPWYAVMQRIDFVFVGFMALMLLLLAVLAAIAIKRLPASRSAAPENVQQSAVAQLQLFGILAAVIVLGFVLNGARDWLFPFAVFTIGQGSARFSSLERIQWGIVIAFVVSLVSALVVFALQARRGTGRAKKRPAR